MKQRRFSRLDGYLPVEKGDWLRVNGRNPRPSDVTARCPSPFSTDFYTLLALLAFALLSIAQCISVALAADAPAPVPDFNQKILPVFTKYCTGCHNSSDRDGKLVLESYADLLHGGKRGTEVIAGHPEQSRLLRVLTGQTQPSMPPQDNERPKAADIALLTAWIDGGAPGPKGAAPDPTVLVVPHVAPVGPVRRAINAVACSPGGRWIAVARYGIVELLSAKTHAVVRTLGPQPGNVNDVTFSADGSMIASAAGQAALFGEVSLWNVADGRLIRKLRGHTDSLFTVAISPDMKLLATAGYDQQIKLRDLHTGKEIRTLKGHNGAVFALAFSPNGKFIACASGARTVKLWDIATGERLETFGQPLLDQYTVAFSPDGQHLAGAGADNRIRIWHISATGKEGTNPIEQTLFADEQPIVKLVYSPDGQLLVSSADDRLIKVWDASTLAPLRTLDRQSDVAPAMAFEPGNGHELIVGRMDGSLAIYDADAGKQIAREARRAAREFVAVVANACSKMLTAGVGARLAPAAAMISAFMPLADFLEAPAVQHETEPNDTPLQANALKKLPVTVEGVLNKPGDDDYFSFEASAGQTLMFDAAARSISSPAVLRLSLFDSMGKLLGDQSKFGPDSDPLLVYHFKKSGQYLIRVDDRMMAGSPGHKYKLAIGAKPFVVGCYPLSVRVGKTADVELLGYNLPPQAKAKVDARRPGEATVQIDTTKYKIREPIKVIVGDLPETVPAESADGMNTNDAIQRATAMAVPGSAAGHLHRRPTGQSPEANYYRFHSNAGENWIIETEAARRGSPIDTRIDVLTHDGKPVERVVLEAVRDSYINFRPLDSLGNSPRLKNWEEMKLNQYVYMNGEVCKLFLYPRGPDSDFGLYLAANGLRRTYFDTTATEHANLEPAFIVEPFQPGVKLPNNGLPAFPIYYSNDDSGDRKIGRDSRLMFTAPADGDYFVRVTDSRGEGGDRFVFRLTVRKPAPDFHVNLAGFNPTVNTGSGQRFVLQADRADYFDGDIRIDIKDIPPGFTVTTPLVIQAGHLQAEGVLCALNGAPAPTAKNSSISQITATARIDGHDFTHVVGGLGQINLGGKPDVVVHLVPIGWKAPTESRKPAAHAKPRAQQWHVVDPISFVSKGGATLQKLGDNSLLAGGSNPDKDSYVVVARSEERNIRAVKLEVLGDPSLPAKSSGRGQKSGLFVLSQFRLSAGPQSDFTKAMPVAIRSVEADYSQSGFSIGSTIDGKGAPGWGVAAVMKNNRLAMMRRHGDPSHTATFKLAAPIDLPNGTILTFTLDQTAGEGRNLGRIRLSVLADEPPELEPPVIPEVVLAPGATTTCKLSIERRNFTGPVQFDVDDLPHGVIVDNIGLNGILIPPGQSEQTVFLTAASWVPETDRLFFAVTQGIGGQASLPVWLRVREHQSTPKAVAAVGQK